MCLKSRIAYVIHLWHLSYMLYLTLSSSPLDFRPNPDPLLSPCLDVSLAFMLNSTSVWENTTGRLHFALAYSNDVDRSHQAMFVGVNGRRVWLQHVSTWVGAMQHPRYLSVGGRPIFQVLFSGVGVTNSPIILSSS